VFKLHVPGMTCGGCARRITTAIHAVDPAAEVIARPPSREVSVRTTADLQSLLAALEDTGYPATASGGVA